MSKSKDNYYYYGNSMVIGTLLLVRPIRSNCAKYAEIFSRQYGTLRWRFVHKTDYILIFDSERTLRFRALNNHCDM